MGSKNQIIFDRGSGKSDPGSGKRGPGSGEKGPRPSDPDGSMGLMEESCLRSDESLKRLITFGLTAGRQWFTTFVSFSMVNGILSSEF